MNYFAHLVLSQPTVESTVGNLLGDFARGVDRRTLDPAIRAGLDNHRAVDRFTDAHPEVGLLKQSFSARRRRFAGIALDVYFDHLLMTHWQQFDPRNLDEVITEFYQRMERAQPLMPGSEMQRTTARMVSHDWFGSYRDIDEVAQALDRIAMRIRFPNEFDHAIEDLINNEVAIKRTFLRFFPELKAHIKALAVEAV